MYLVHDATASLSTLLYSSRRVYIHLKPFALFSVRLQIFEFFCIAYDATACIQLLKNMFAMRPHVLASS